MDYNNSSHLKEAFETLSNRITILEQRLATDSYDLPDEDIIEDLINDVNEIKATLDANVLIERLDKEFRHDRN